MARRTTPSPGATMTRTTRASTKNTKYPTYSFIRQANGESKSSEAGVQIRLCSSYQINWRTNRRTEIQGTPCPGSCCREVLGGEGAEEAFVPCPFEAILVGDAFVAFTGWDSDWVVGAAWGEGIGGRVARSSGAWTCWMRRTNCCNPTSLSVASRMIDPCLAHHFVGEERTREKCGRDQCH